MFVGWNMTSKLITVSPDTPILKARELMDSHRISHLPVTDGKAQLLGIVTDRDLKQAWASPASTLSVYELTYVLQKVTVETVMTRKVITVSPDKTIERAARIVHDSKVGALPVVENNKLVGIITVTDLMEALLKALGMSEDSGRILLLVRDRMGVLAQIGRIMHQEAINIRSIVIMPLKDHEDIGQLIMRVKSSEHPKALAALREAGFRPVTEYVDDLETFLAEGAINHGPE